MHPIHPAAWLAGTLIGGYLLSRYLNYHPKPVEPVEARNSKTAPCLLPGQRIKVVTFNVQFLAGTGYHFFYDGGPDTLVARDDIEATAVKVGAFIASSNADLVLLQEVDCGARRTSFLDELNLLRRALPEEMQNHAATYYWKSKFVPHPKILGPAGTKLVIFSRYKLGRAWRYQLPRTPSNPIESDFNLKRAILEVELPFGNGEFLTVLNTHLEAFPKDSNVMERQIQKLLERLNWLSQHGRPWILGGDFNLLPPGQLGRLSPQMRGIHREPSVISAIYDRYAGVPKVPEATGTRMHQYFTFTQRSGTDRIPVRTLDYLFASPTVTIGQYSIRQEGMMNVSDHLPVIAEFTLSAQGQRAMH
ncbi:MAG: endonuclease/exonuclease/phosphatase family protein [Verrucomicrobia bacterium]|nr:endonuclease/exonuclease/phosphatase family protein [Verrucomicrobiota bacterium]